MKKTLLILSSIILLSSLAHAQQRVGLVLSGGAAKGLAHLGAIKALEENNVPIDYIVGTSMGSVVGACYAAGFTIEYIEDILLSEEFQKWVKGEIRSEYNYYFNKDEDMPSWVNLNFSIDSSLNATINSSLADDLSINFVLAERFARESKSADYDFDKLFVPYRAVASEVFMQRTVVLDSGNLGRSVRASMSVPLFYRPIKVNNEYLFDGGIYNNFPTDIMNEEFAPDIIIGVNVASKVFEEYPNDRDNELISNSLLFMVLDKSEPSGVGEGGIYVAPDISEYTSLDFDKVNALIDSGYTATMRQMPEIKSKIIAIRSQELLNAKRSEFKSSVDSVMNFGDIRFHGFNSKQRSYIRKLFGKGGDNYSFEDIKTGYYRLVSEDYFKTVYPDIGYNEVSGLYDFHFYGRPRNNFTTKLGGVISSRNINHVYLGFKYARFDKYFSKTNVDFFVGNFYKSASLKSKIVLPGRTRLYVGPDLRYNRWDYINTNELVLLDVKRTIVDMTDRYIGLEVGLPIGSQYKLSASVGGFNNDNKFSNRNEINSLDTLDAQKIKGRRYKLSIDANTLNRPQYASSGRKIGLYGYYYNVDEIYEPGSTAISDVAVNSTQEWIRIKFELEQYFNVSKRYTYGVLAEAVVSNQEDFATYNGTIINTPTFSPLSDSKSLILQKLRAYNYLALGGRNVISIAPKIDFRLEGHLFKSFNQLISRTDQTTKEETFSLSDTFFSGTAGLVYHSPIGPIAANLNYYDDPENQWGLFVHFGYMLFKQSSME